MALESQKAKPIVPPCLVSPLAQPLQLKDAVPFPKKHPGVFSYVAELSDAMQSKLALLLPCYPQLQAVPYRFSLRFIVGQDGSNIPCAMQHPDDFNSAFDDAIENDIVTNR